MFKHVTIFGCQASLDDIQQSVFMFNKIVFGMQFVNFFLHYNYNNLDIQLSYLKLKYDNSQNLT